MFTSCSISQSFAAVSIYRSTFSFHSSHHIIHHFIFYLSSICHFILSIIYLGRQLSHLRTNSAYLLPLSTFYTYIEGLVLIFSHFHLITFSYIFHFAFIPLLRVITITHLLLNGYHFAVIFPLCIFRLHYGMAANFHIHFHFIVAPFVQVRFSGVICSCFPFSVSSWRWRRRWWPGRRRRRRRRR